jgi:hypothetical protein
MDLERMRKQERIWTRLAQRSEEKIAGRRLAVVLENERLPEDGVVHVHRAAAYLQQAEPGLPIEDPDKAIRPMSQEGLQEETGAGGSTCKDLAIRNSPTSS